MNKKKIVFLTGAGMSVESGLKTFRDASNGLWENYPVAQVATHSGWKANPVFVNEFYNMLRLKYKDVKPNNGHKAIADLEKEYDVTVITQNVDNLHEQAGSSRVIHLHGEIMKACSDGQWGPGNYIIELDPENPVIEPGTLAPDGTLLRPFVVFFEEPVPMMRQAIEVIKEVDILVIIGTSLVVSSASTIIEFVKNDTPIWVIDPGEININRDVHRIKLGASAGIAEFINILKGQVTPLNARNNCDQSDNIK